MNGIKALFRKWACEMQMPSVESAVDLLARVKAAEAEIEKVQTAFDHAGIAAVDDEHRRYTLLERLRLFAAGKDFFIRKTDELRDEIDALREAPIRRGALIWLGQWRSKIPPEAVSALQDILCVENHYSHRTRMPVSIRSAKDIYERG